MVNTVDFEDVLTNFFNEDFITMQKSSTTQRELFSFHFFFFTLLCFSLFYFFILFFSSLFISYDEGTFFYICTVEEEDTIESMVCLHLGE